MVVSISNELGSGGRSDDHERDQSSVPNIDLSAEQLVVAKQKFLARAKSELGLSETDLERIVSEQFIIQESSEDER